jgi:hypothetical protein
MRKGNFSGEPQRSATTIHILFYKDGVPTTGYNLLEYDDETREWKELNNP